MKNNENTNIIYQHYNTISMKSYIGLTTQTMNKRWKEHLVNAFKTNADGSWFYNWKFYRAIRKYPLDSWIHIELYKYRDDGTELPLGEYEKFFITKYDSYNNGYNSTLGGEGIIGITSEIARNGKINSRWKKDVKGFYYDKLRSKFIVNFSYLGKNLNFDRYDTEQEAKERANYLMSLNDVDFLNEYAHYKSSYLSRVKGYIFDKSRNTFIVRVKVNGKNKEIGAYLTEHEAIDKVIEIRKEIQL